MRTWLVPVGAVGVAVGLAPAATKGLGHAAAAEAPSISHVANGVGTSSRESPPVDLTGLDLARIGVGDDGASAPLAGGRTAHLTVDAALQSDAWSIMAGRHIPEAALVLLDPETGNVLVYASHVESGPVRDIAAEARAPAASVFKIITASALIDDAGLGPETRQCYSGGEEKILPSDLVDNPARDHWCVTLSGAMGRSINAVFARLAGRLLDKPKLEDAASRFSFGQSIPFDARVEPSTINVPDDSLGFARTAAGFWNTTLSPMHAAWISAAIERGGESIHPHIVLSLTNGKDTTELHRGPEPGGRVVSPETAAQITTMLEHTVSEGTSFRAFHDARRTPFLPGMSVAGKTGTLTDEKAQRFYTWFTGFAPSRPVQGIHPVVVAALVVNGPSWRVKANVLAREMLQSYFADQHVPGVNRPKLLADRED